MSLKVTLHDKHNQNTILSTGGQQLSHSLDIAKCHSTVNHLSIKNLTGDLHSRQTVPGRGKKENKPIYGAKIQMWKVSSNRGLCRFCRFRLSREVFEVSKCLYLSPGLLWVVPDPITPTMAAWQPNLVGREGLEPRGSDIES